MVSVAQEGTMLGIRRRELITLLGGAAAWPLAARAQQGQQMRRVGVLIGETRNDPASQSHLAAFREALAQLGWIEGRNLRIELRFADGNTERVRALASEVVNLVPEVIFVSTGVATRTLQQETQTIPIIFAGASVGGDVVRDIARPEGNTTGFQILYPSIGGKWLELLKEAAPRLARVAVIGGVDSIGAFNNYLGSIEAAGQTLAVKVLATRFSGDDDLTRMIDAFAAEPNGGLIVLPGTATSTRDNRQLILLLAAKHRLVAIHFDKSLPAEGGFMSYGSDFTDLHRRAAGYVDRILRGAKISELPVQFPTKFELVINLKTAKAIGLTVPETFLVIRADQVIE
jgi:putative ABC transport system substrate-binding protein